MISAVTHCLLAQQRWVRLGGWTVGRGSNTSCPYSYLFLGLSTVGAEEDVQMDFPNV